MLELRQVLLAKVETVPGVDAAPVATTDAVRCGVVNPSLGNEELRRVDLSQSISALKAQIGKKRLSFQITLDLKGSGTAGVAPDFGALLQACALKETVTGGVKVEYKPVSDEAPQKSCTIYLYMDGVVFKATMCRGNVDISTPAGALGAVTINMEGNFAAIEDAALPTATFQTSEPPQVQSAGLVFGAYADAVARGFSLSSGNTIATIDSVNSTDGRWGVRVTGRDPKWSSTINAVLEATSPFWGDLIDRDTRSISFTVGANAGNKVVFTMPTASINQNQPGSDAGVKTWALSGQACESTPGADDNYTISFQ